MAEYEFTLVIDGPLDDEVVLDRLYEAGCSDATLGSVDGVDYGEFSREARNFAQAVGSAIRDVESVEGLRVARVEPDNFVTISEIAERLGRSRESVRLLAAGERGSGDFPAPVSHLRERSRLWRWSDVSAWADEAKKPEERRARFVAALNAALEMRRASGLPQMEREIVGRLAGG